MIRIERRLARLEQAASGPAQTLLIFVHLVPRERDLPATATANGREWCRQPHELEADFVARVAAEARPARPGCAVLVFLE